MGAYVFGKIVALDHGAARSKVIEALGKEGFGVLTEIDVTATLQKARRPAGDHRRGRRSARSPAARAAGDVGSV